MKNAREKVLAAATTLFYKRGIRGVGIDEIVRHSKVTKMTLYKYFRSKDDLAAAFLQEIHRQWSLWFTERVARLSTSAGRPEDRVLAIFDALEEWFEMPSFRGCPFINTVAELSERKHPAHQAAVELKEKLLATIEDALRPLRQNRRELSEQLLLLVDGAIVRATMTGSSRPARVARKAAAQLLAAPN